MAGAMALSSSMSEAPGFSKAQRVASAAESMPILAAAEESR